MKINPSEPKRSKFDTGKDELNIIDFEEKRNDKFWQDVSELIAHGLPAYDKKGHSTELRFRVRPVQREIFGSIINRFQDGFFRSQASFYRCIIAVGCKTVLEYLKRTKGMEISEIEAGLRGLNMMARQERFEELESDLKSFQQSIVQSNSAKKGEKIEKLDDILDKLSKLR